MASALRKLFRGNHNSNNNNNINNRKRDEPSNGVFQPPPAASTSTALTAFRRLFARACSTVHISPADGSSTSAATNNNNNAVVVTNGADSALMVSGLLKSSKNNNGGCITKSGASAAHAKLVRTRRLMREFQEMTKKQRDGGLSAPLFTVELAGGDNLYEWHVKLNGVDPDSDLYRDMRETKTPYILLSVTFPDNFPFAPPFMRVVSPRIEKGFVMDGGAICMELLTPAGWASAYTVEAIVMQFSASLVKGQGRIVRKVKGSGGGAVVAAAVAAGSGKGFSRKAAEASFRSLVKTHEKYGWVTPPLADG